AVVAVAVASLVWPPHPVQELDTRLRRLRRELVDDFAAVADDLDAGTGAAASRLDDIRAHSLEAVRDVFELDRARNAMRWNPRRRRDAAALDEAELRISLGARLYRHARSLARDVADMGSAVTGTASGRRLAA